MRRQPAAYQTITDLLRDRLHAGNPPPGTSFPTARQLAADLGVGVGVVHKAFEQLAAEGLVEIRRGIGTFALSRGPMLIERGTPSFDTAAVWCPAAGVSEDLVSREELADQLAPDEVSAVLGVGRCAIAREIWGLGPMLARMSTLYTAPGSERAAPILFCDDLRVRGPMAEEAARLRVPAGRLLLEVLRQCADPLGRVVAIERHVLVPDAYVLRYRYNSGATQLNGR